MVHASVKVWCFLKINFQRNEEMRSFVEEIFEARQDLSGGCRWKTNWQREIHEKSATQLNNNRLRRVVYG
jgi:hypothetical protein